MANSDLEKGLATRNIRGVAGRPDALPPVEPPRTHPTMAFTAPEPSQVPLVIAGYEVLAELGRGGMGVVYKARHGGLGRLVALKMILAARLASQEQLLRFRLEGEAAASLQHPNVVQIFEVGVWQDQPFLVFEYVEGGTLAQRLHESTLPPQEAARLLETLARGVQAAHERGIIHRDLKPGNILLTPDGTPKISDFGLAKHQGVASEALTETGRVMGTPAYMAPEQAAGHSRNVGPHTDVYALGAMLYHLLAGHPPVLARDMAEAIVAVLTQEPIRLRRISASIPLDLETICHRCLEKDPTKRYQSARDLADDLNRFLEHRPIHARRVGQPERLWKWTKRRPLTAILLLALTFVTLLGLTGVVGMLFYALDGWAEAEWQTNQARAERKAAELAQALEAEHRKQATAAGAKAQAESVRATLANEQAQANLDFSRLVRARLEWRQNNLNASSALLEQIAPARRGWEWRYLQGLHASELWRIPFPAAPVVGGVTYSPDGKYLATASGNHYDSQIENQGAVTLWNTQDYQSAKVLTPRLKQSADHIAYNSDGSLLAACNRWADTLHIWRTADATLLRTVRLPELRTVHALAWSPDGKQFALAHERGHAILLDAESGKSVRKFHESNAPVLRVAWSGDGRFLASSTDQLHIWDPVSLNLLHRFKVGGSDALAFSPDSTLLAASQNGRIRVFSTADWHEVAVLVGHEGTARGLAFSPDGRQLVTGGSDTTVRLWESDTGMLLRVWRGHLGRVDTVCFHPEGHQVASASTQPGEVRIWDLTRAQEHFCISDPYARAVDALGFTPDNRRVLVLRAGGKLETRSLFGTLIREQRIDTGSFWRVPAKLAAFSGDTQRVAALAPDDGLRVRVWNTATGIPLAASYRHRTEVLVVSMSQDGRLVASGADEFAVWEADTGRVRLSFGRTLERGSTLQLSPDGKWLFRGVSYFGTSLRRPMAKVELELPEPRLVDVTKRLAPAIPICHSLEVWPVPGNEPDAERPQEPVTTIQHPGSIVFSVACLPEKNLLATGSQDGLIMVWRLSDGKPLFEEPIRGPVGLDGLAFSPDGRLLACSTRTHVVLWTVSEKAEVLILRAAPPRSWDNGFSPRVAWTPDGRRLLATNWDFSVSLWDGADQADPTRRQEEITAAADRVVHWRLKRALENTQPYRAFALKHHLKFLAKLQPPERDILRTRGELYSRLGQWEKAAADFSAALKGVDATPLDWRQLALLRLAVGDQKGCRDACERMVQQFSRAPAMITLPDLAMTLSLGKGMEADLKRLVAQRGKADWVLRFGWEYHAKAMAHLRLKQYDEAIQAAETGLVKDLDWHRMAALQRLVLAQAHHAKGQTAEAKRLWQEANRWLQQEEQTIALEKIPMPTGIVWSDWVWAKLLTKETAAVLGE